MGYRGRLIHKFLCDLRRLDTAATATVVGGGYDDVFNEALPIADGSQVGAPSRREHAQVLLPCQIDRIDWGDDEMLRSGHDTETKILLHLFMEDVENAGLVDDNGAPKIYAGDRVEAILDEAGNVQEKFPDPPGMFVTGVERAGYGLDMGSPARFNLLTLTVSKPRQGGEA